MRLELVMDLGLLRKRLNMKTCQVCLSEKGTDYSLYITISNSPVSLQPKSVKLTELIV